MQNADVPNKRLPKVPTQKRSIERFERILDCAEQLLTEGRAEEISIYEVAEKAEMQAQSVYRLFPSAEAINYALAQRYLNMMSNRLESTEVKNAHSWQEAIEESLHTTLEFYTLHPHAMELILGSAVPLDIRSADRKNITRLAISARNWFNARAQIETLDLRHFQITIDIIDAIWGQSYYSHKEITPFYFQESIRAATSYLELYLPRHIPNDDPIHTPNAE